MEHIPGDFAHLHVHTEYSLLDGLSRIQTLARQAKALGMQHLAITDHGAMYGALEFYQACKQEGVHALLGVESYMVRDHMERQKHKQGEKRNFHQLLLAKTNVGYHNLLQLVTIANTEGMQSNKACIDKRLLAQYGEGIIATSSCLGGEIPQLLLAGKTEEASQVARWYRDTLGAENFYLELQAHGSDPEQERVNKALYRIHQESGIPMIATNDLHYVSQDDARAHEVLLCVQTKDRMSNPRRFAFKGDEFFLRSPAQMYALFPDLTEALQNTVRIAELCEVDPFTRKASLPQVSIPEPYSTPEEYLQALCIQGVVPRYGEMSEGIQRRLSYELAMILQKRFVSYFLVVADYVGWARRQGIRCLARGSAAGSIVAYLLGITNVDPLHYGLPFERFLNPDRSDMPDIDMDFPDDRREEVIAYLARTYGQECVAQIATFMTMAAKQSIHDVARVFDQQDIGTRITRLITDPKATLTKERTENTTLKELYTTDAQAAHILDLAQELEGTVRTTGVHAAGFLISNQPLVNFTPLQYREGRIASQYPQAVLESLGLVKYDILGLSNLTIIDNAVKMIQNTRGESLDLEHLPLTPCDDETLEAKRQKAFALLATGNTIRVFQLESQKMREYIRQLKPTCIQDIMAMIALYRPGPMDSIPDFIAAKHGKKHVTYLDPRLKQYLEESYGIIVYQDQVLQIAVELAGFSWGKVNAFRKALSKKHMEEVQGYRADFVGGCITNGMKKEGAEKLFDLILPFGGYGFNKSHAASYAVVAYYTAYLKANYSEEYMAASLTAQSNATRKEDGGDGQIALLIAECKRLGITILPPDVNASHLGFTIEQRNIRFGLQAIKGIGEQPCLDIVKEREEHGRYRDFIDYCTRLHGKIGTKAGARGTIETLIRAGAMDTLGDRTLLLGNVDRVLPYAKNEQRMVASGQLSLLEMIDPNDPTAITLTLSQDVPSISPAQRLADEKELLDVYFSGHPLADYASLFEHRKIIDLAEITPDLDGQQVTIGGMVKESRAFQTRKQERMCTLLLEDQYGGKAEATIFPRHYVMFQPLCQKGKVIVLSGTVKQRQDREEVSVLCDHLEEILIQEEQNQQSATPSLVHLTLEQSGVTPQDIANDLRVVERLHRCLRRGGPGQDHFEIFCMTPRKGGNKQYMVTFSIPDNTFRYTSAIHQQLVSILGGEHHITVTIEQEQDLAV